MIHIIYGDITKFEGDAIVNAANSSLLGGGGVDGAIHRAAGLKLLEECRFLGGCNPGDAKITKGYNLNARYIVHTVGPIWKGGTSKEAETLASCYSRSLELARQYGLQSIAFPNISTGAYGFPKEQAARIAIDTVKKDLQENGELEVYFYCLDPENYQLYSELLA